MTAFLLSLRNGDFLTGDRIRVWSSLFLAAFIAAIVYLFATAHGLNDYAGRPLGTDFSNVYAAGVSALHGDAAAPFDILKQQKLEQAIFGPKTQLYGWHYPPFFLLVAAPLAKLPYIAALIVWQLASLALYLLAMQALLKRSASPELADGKAGSWRRWVSPPSSSISPMAITAFTAALVCRCAGAAG